MSTLNDRQRDFLHAAIEIVSRQGFSKLTIRNIAAAVGVTEPAVYLYFPNKLALVTAVLDDLNAAISPHFLTLINGGGSPLQSFASFIRGLFEELRLRPAYATFVFSEEIFNNEPQLRTKLQQVLNNNILTLTNSFESLQSSKNCRTDIDAQQIALVTLASIRLAVSRWHINNSELQIEDLAEQLIETLGVLFELDSEAGSDARGAKKK